eukprot:scaffold2870_cov190-Alexandrium_tamarense.AAC.2
MRMIELMMFVGAAGCRSLFVWCPSFGFDARSRCDANGSVMGGVTFLDLYFSDLITSRQPVVLFIIDSSVQFQLVTKAKMRTQDLVAGRRRQQHTSTTSLPFACCKTSKT